MRVAIVHYHLRPGGVTRVIRTATQALASAGVDGVVLAGERPPNGDLPVQVVAGLGYLRDAGILSAPGLVAAMRNAAASALGAPPDLWHFHNHALGKNVLLGEAVALLAAAGERLVLQVHDLVEDGRPANYAVVANCHRLYPTGPRLRYAFLNTRDAGIFRRCGLPAAQSVLLPNALGPATGDPFNPVSLRHDSEISDGSVQLTAGTLKVAEIAGNALHISVISASQRHQRSSWCKSPDRLTMEKLTGLGEPLVLYPVRGIRRKNLGEALLLAALAPAGARFAITRAPEEPQWLGIHDAWQAFAGELRLPVEFAVVARLAPGPGSDTSLDAWLDHATHLLTTSVAEGFGFAFLDAAAMGKPLLGRNLPHLSADQVPGADGLYDRILVPLDAVGAATLKSGLQHALTADYHGYGRNISASEIARAFAALTRGGWIDFGNLPENLQRELILRVRTDPDSFELWVESHGQRTDAATWLKNHLAGGGSPSLPDLTPWSGETYQARLLALYADLLAAPASSIDYLPPARLLDCCLTPEGFHFLRGT